MATELREVCQAIQADENIRLVILTGEGDQFSVGREALPEDLSGSPASVSLDWLKGIQAASRSEEHTSELQSRTNLVCRLLLEKKK